MLLNGKKDLSLELGPLCDEHNPKLAIMCCNVCGWMTGCGHRGFAWISLITDIFGLHAEMLYAPLAHSPMDIGSRQQYSLQHSKFEHIKSATPCVHDSFTFLYCDFRVTGLVSRLGAWQEDDRQSSLMLV